MIYLATNCDKKFYETKPKTVIESLLKYKSEEMEIMFFQIESLQFSDPITVEYIFRSFATYNCNIVWISK